MIKDTVDGLHTLTESIYRNNNSLINKRVGLGTSRARSTHTTYAYNPVYNRIEYENAFESNWLVSRIIQEKAEDAVRNWRDFKCKDGADDIRDCEKKLDIKNVILEALTWQRLYGGAGILIFTPQDFSEPLNLNLIKKGDLTNLVAFDRWYLTPEELNVFDPTKPNYLKPEFYLLNGSVRIHESHIIRFEGNLQPLRRRSQSQGWGGSELKKCLDAVNSFLASKMATDELLLDSKNDVITRENLIDEIASDEEAVAERYAAFNEMKGLLSLAVLDGSETYDRKMVNFAGIPDLIKTFMIVVAAAAQYPVTKLFGTSATGMSATGEGDDNNYHYSVMNIQSKMEKSLSKLDEVLVRSALGEYPKDYSFSWNPLSARNELQDAQVNLINAQRDQIYKAAEIIKESQIMKNLKSDNIYSITDEDIEEQEEYENENVFENDDTNNQNIGNIENTERTQLPQVTPTIPKA